MTNTKYNPDEPIVAIATALAPSALGIVRVSGKDCVKLISAIFSRPNQLLKAEGNSIVYGWICDGNEKIDEVLISVFRAPKSFTGEEMCEINCHGGVAVVKAVYETLLKNGFRPAERGEFTFRAYINGKSDLTKAEAVREIIDSKTNASRSHAAGRLTGSLFKEIDFVKTLLTDTLAAIEVDIEYPEDEETIADSFDKADLEKAKSNLFELASSWKSEKLYQDGAKVVLAGKTNAGKSSLFNVLLKEDRSIVSDIEGTTRDWIESWVSFDGIPARLFDTAGLRKTDDLIEAKGVELTNDLVKDADLILYLVDSTKGLLDEDWIFIKENYGIPLIVVFNKADLAQDEKRCNIESIKNKLKAENSGEKTYFVRVSAKKGNGILELTELVKNVLLGDSTQKSDSAGLGSTRQRDCVLNAYESVTHALKIADEGSYALDAVVQDLEDALENLGEVTGEVTPDDVLGSIFSHFCVGK
ncbi:tRNA uridine-5-carboxymethylaminomethyl(34) synthesis GTPase MnmE [Treponema pectinovorum]|uniref:tRNA uridine-5-carboxymethylaminomethyl(34) synthesis GTPase MnmE n=1 Tax=Treponema pectinovorum TaxID=164 RepID=UPI0011C70D81|nr:tRNA uridine-5-carboxymethylaminomethyl(34) synthesis GTPase MnmE [Treponema pectinovorum]